ncbi:hypothetical protein G9P44_000792 [Scheffersomyces stipitis]|nr:hypothetical protein G9P44_000792 [Scheffersomyces stipitis]
MEESDISTRPEESIVAEGGVGDVSAENGGVRVEIENKPTVNMSSVPGSESTADASSTHTYSTRSKERQKEEEIEKKSKLKQRQHNVVVHPRLKPVPFKSSDLFNSSTGLGMNVVHEIDGKVFYQSEENPHNRRGFKYKPCRPNPLFVSNLYSTTEMPPYEVGPSYFDIAPGVVHTEDMKLVSTQQGWRSVRTNCGIREGKYFFEFNIVKANDGDSRSHVRIGLGRKEASLDAPVGFDGYSYGLRDVNGEFITLSRPKEPYVEGGFKTGDIVGFLVEFPSLQVQKKAVDDFVGAKKSLIATASEQNGTEIKEEHQRKKKKTAKKEDVVEENDKFYCEGNILRDQIPIRYKGALYYEQYEYTNTKIMDHLLNPVTIFGEKAVLENSNVQEKNNVIPVIPQSRIRIFKNGIEQKETVHDLYSFLPTDIDNEDLNIAPNTKQQQNPNYRNTDDGSLGYYPMMSVFQNGIVGINAGPDFKFPIVEEGVKPLSDRYNEAVVEEWYWDLIDEVEGEYLDSFDI